MADEWNEIGLFALCYISRIHYHENLPDVCELHRSFVKFIDLILSDAEAPSFAIGNDPDFFITSIFSWIVMWTIILCTSHTDL